MKRILGLDLGTNSIGWSIVEEEEKAQATPCDNDVEETGSRRIVGAGSRIIPMDAATIGDFEKGNLQSPAADRTKARSMRRLYERSKLRRERLLRVLNKMDYLPSHFRDAIDFDTHPGKFKDDKEPLIAYYTDEAGRHRFGFMGAFEEMLADFRDHHPEMVADGKRVPYDWTVYYLRKKALTQPVSKEELSWILLHFNAKRGYYQLIGEETEDHDKKENQTEEYMTLTVADIKQLEADKKDASKFWYEITYNNGAKQRAKSPTPPRKTGDRVEVIVTTTYDKDGNIARDKEGDPKIKLRTPKEEDWTLMKKRTEHNIDISGLTVGAYIYDNILTTPYVKVRGKLIHTIERKYYKDELTRILRKQSEYHPELNDKALLERCARELYGNNEAHVESLMKKDLTNMLVDDIIFYQRPLKSKKSLISDCPYEVRRYIDTTTGEIATQPLKCIQKSHPLYQEFRLWQWVGNLRIFKRQTEKDGKLKLNDDVTRQFLPDAHAKACLFDWLNQKKEIKQSELLKYKPWGLKKTADDYRWNYVEDKIYPCNETMYDINRRLDKLGCDHLSYDNALNLWHIGVSVLDADQRKKALASFARRQGFDEQAFADAFKSYAPDRTSYGAYSEKAIKKLLALMRMDCHWSQDAIDPNTRQRIDNIINGVADDSISQQVREVAGKEGLDSIDKFCGLSVWMACYIVYNRHSEATDLTRWEKPSDITSYLNTALRHGSLRNPIVEKVVTETLKVVKDLWEAYGKIDEVHIEMGRDLKNTAQERQRISAKIAEGEQANMRIRLLLQEFAKPEYNVADVRPNSPMQQEQLKIFEDYALANSTEMTAEIASIVKDLGKSGSAAHIDQSKVMRYRLWLEQQYQSPYTGATIPLSRLFTREYEIEHVIPRSKYFDDSLSNKVICESEVNKDKGNMLGYEYVCQNGGKIIQVFQNGQHHDVTVFDKSQYEDFVKRHYTGKKFKNMMMDEIPESFVSRQLNDSRYMSRKIMEMLSMLVREEGEQEATSKNVIPTTGNITDRLKADWGLKDVWNSLITPRFERLNKMTNSQQFGSWVDREGKRFFQINMPLELSAGFSKKRIDHRHHAMDAIVIAFTTRSHVNYLNNAAATKGKEGLREDLKHKLCIKDHGNSQWTFRKPYDNFTQDARKTLEGIVVSFKQNLRVVSHTSNYYTHYGAEGKKIVSKQEKGDGWAIRKSLHKDTVSGLVSLQKKKEVRLSVALDHWHDICDRKVRAHIKSVVDAYGGNADTKTLLRYFKDRGNKIGDKDITRLHIYYYTGTGDDAMTATRKAVDTSFDIKAIESITDSGIRKIMTAHLHRYDDADGKTHPELAFSPEGIATMNRDIRQLNGGKNHMPILKVRKAEPLGMKFAVGSKGNKNKKFVEADKGTNLFFAIYADNDGKRTYETIPFNVAVERKKLGLSEAPDTNQKGDKLLFTLSPNDLVYVPEKDENVDVSLLDRKRIYKMVSCSGNRCYFVPATNAKVIIDGFELNALNKIEYSLDKQNIKECCLKLSVDRIGRITKICQ